MAVVHVASAIVGDVVVPELGVERRRPPRVAHVRPGSAATELLPTFLLE